jgi:hypothetical protein
MNETPFLEREVGFSFKQCFPDVIDAYQDLTTKMNISSRIDLSREPILVRADFGLKKAARKEGLSVWNCLTGTGSVNRKPFKE